MAATQRILEIIWIIALAAGAVLMFILAFTKQPPGPTPYEYTVNFTFPGLGTLEGKHEQGSVSFFGIPYAKQPERWRHADYPPNKFDYRPAYLRQKSAPICVQSCYAAYGGWVPGCPTLEEGWQNEKCLYLHISVPERMVIGENQAEERKGKLPVFIYFHGGAFTFGSGETPLYSGAYLGAMADAIIVTVNYRLNIFGFMPMDDTWEDTPSIGNFGLTDQQNAIHFVYDNIGAMGGDNTKITIGGQSAGSESTYLQIMNKNGDHQKWFMQGIMMSIPTGLPLMEGEFAKTTMGNAVIKTAANETNNEDCVDDSCLYALSSAELLDVGEKAVLSFIPNRLRNLTSIFQGYDPVIDYNLVSGQFVDLSKNGTNTDKPIMIGHVGDEGEIFVQAILEMIYQALPDEKKPEDRRMTYEGYQFMLSLIWNIKGDPMEAKKQVAEIEKTYPFTLDCERFHTETPSNDVCDGRDVANHFVRDALMSCAQRATIDNLSKKTGAANTYFWQFDEWFPWVPPELNMQYEDSYRRCDKMACHGSDIAFMFGLDYLFTSIKFGEKPVQLARMFQGYVANFLHNGDPNDNARVYKNNWTKLLAGQPDNAQKLTLPDWPVYNPDPEEWGFQYFSSRIESIVENRIRPEIHDINGNVLVNLTDICGKFDDWDSYGRH